MNKFVHTVEKNQTLTYIAKLYNTTPNAVSAGNKTPLHVGQRLLIFAQEGTRHTVQPFETLGKLAKKYGTTEQKLMELNNLSSPKIYIGQQLFVGK